MARRRPGVPRGEPDGHVEPEEMIAHAAAMPAPGPQADALEATQPARVENPRAPRNHGAGKPPAEQ